MITAANITFAFKGSTRRASLTHKFMKGDANGVPLINLFETADKYGGGHSCSWTKQGHLATETSHSTDLKSPTRKEDLSSCSRLFRKIRNLARACVLMALSFPGIPHAYPLANGRREQGHTLARTMSQAGKGITEEYRQSSVARRMMGLAHQWLVADSHNVRPSVGSGGNRIMTCLAIGVMEDDVCMNRVSSPAYAGSHGCPSSAVVCDGGWIKPWGSTNQA
jgi:hypothetical protein